MGKMTTALALAISFMATAVAQTPQSLPEQPNSTVGYSSVQEALSALQSRSGVNVSVVRGWRVFADEKALAIWSFSPETHPSHPTVVKRQVVPVGSGSEVRMNVLCEASKAACDGIVREFAAMNGMSLGQ